MSCSWPRAPGAQRQPHGVLALAAHAAEDQDVGQVRTAQDHEHRANQQESLDHRPIGVAREDLRSQPWEHARSDGLKLAVLLWVAFGEARREHVEFRLC